MKGAEKLKRKIHCGYLYRLAISKINGRHVIGLYRQVYLEGGKKPLVEFYSQEFGFSFHKPEKFYRECFIERGNLWIRYLLIREHPPHTYSQTPHSFSDKTIYGFIEMTGENHEQILKLKNQIGLF